MTDHIIEVPHISKRINHESFIDLEKVEEIKI
jgi:hypothetical protein